MIKTLLIIVLCLGVSKAYCQADSSLLVLANIPTQYFSQLDRKVTQYKDRTTRKTIRTLEKLARWETRLRGTLERVHPEAAAKLFNSGQMTFSELLNKVKQGEAALLQHRQVYDKYRDDLTTSMLYLQQKESYLQEGVIAKVKSTSSRLQELNRYADSTEAIQEFIRERKRELMLTAFQHLGANKYLSKINRESWYYVETMKNYKEIFSDEKKLESTIKTVLNRIPGFGDFIKSNGMLAGLFDIPSGNAQILPGMQTKDEVMNIIQSQIKSMGPNAEKMVTQNLSEAHSYMNKLQIKLMDAASANNGKGWSELPDFKPNTQRTKTLAQRIEYGFTLQFNRGDFLLPTATELALSIGYKFTDGITTGIGVSYKLGLGNFSKISITTEGIGLRSYLDCKLKKNIFLSGGYEKNYLSSLDNNTRFQDVSPWRESALLGLSKRINLGKGKMKATKLSILYDFLNNQYTTQRSSWIFRIGYVF